MAAHNIQDLEFCAQMAARVNAMREHWWLPFRPVDLALIIEKFTQNPRQASFAALHKAGDTYEHRAPTA